MVSATRCRAVTFDELELLQYRNQTLPALAFGTRQLLAPPSPPPRPNGAGIELVFSERRSRILGKRSKLLGISRQRVVNRALELMSCAVDAERAGECLALRSSGKLRRVAFRDLPSLSNC